MPSLAVFGTDLTAAEKQALGLTPTRLAFTQDAPIPLSAEKMGLRENDVIIGVDGLELEMPADQFLGYIRQSYLIGDRITLNVLRKGKRIDLPITLK